MTVIPYNDEAEWSVVSQMLTRPNAISEVIGAQLELDDFYRPDTRLIFEAAVENYYADVPVDPVTIGERLRSPLARQWECPEQEVARRLYQQAQARAALTAVAAHTKIVKDKSLIRRLEDLMSQVRHQLSTDPDVTPEQLGERLASEAAQITMGTKKRSEVLSFTEVGREYIRHLNRQRAAKQQGIELAAYTGLKFVDNFTKGIAPTELMFVAGEPGVGKSAITWAMAQGFARRQLVKGDKRVACLVLSLEMALIGSSGRLASSLIDIEGEKLREGDITNDELTRLIAEWKNLESLPLYWNFASNFKMSQMRALIVEAIRRHNVGMVIIDHFRMFDPDRRINNANQEDEAKARYLKEDIAKDLDVAVVCLAHTVKTPRDSDPRPRLADLRGSGQVAAHADIVAMMFRPYMHATEDEKNEGVITPTDAELIFVKNRNGSLGTSLFWFDAPRMDIRDN